jgi:tRNA(Ile)-lysidine synthase
MLMRTVRATIEKYGMLRKGDRVVAGVSGGPDSVALLHILNSLKDIYKIGLSAAHLEHGIRGEESIEDMRFVEGLCGGLSIPLRTKQANVPEIAEASGQSLEATARKLRYAFFEEVVEATGSNKIATGHNANDRAETLLLNLLRGSGMAGLSGIRPAQEDRIVRPLIEATRQEVEAYLKDKQIAFRIDSSNLDDRYERNKVRRVLVPLIEKEFNPRIIDSLARTAGVFSIMDGYLKAKVEEVMKACSHTGNGRVTIDLKPFSGTPQALQLFMLYSVLRSLEGDDQVVSFDILNAVLNLALRSKSGSRVDIGSGLVALREFDRLVVGRDLALVERYDVRLGVPGPTEVEAAGCTFVTEVLKQRPATGEVYRSGNTAYFDFGKIELPLAARSWREGDRFVPFGLSGTKKVHDIFIDEKVPVSRRSKIPIISDGDGIIWIAGVRRADRARITDDTRTILKITYRKGE